MKIDDIISDSVTLSAGASIDIGPSDASGIWRLNKVMHEGSVSVYAVRPATTTLIFTRAGRGIVVNLLVTSTKLYRFTDTSGASQVISWEGHKVYGTL